MADRKQAEDFDFDATSSAIPRDVADQPKTGKIQDETKDIPLDGLGLQRLEGDELNATMMAIDVGTLDIDKTNTRVRIDLPQEADQLSKDLSERRSRLKQFLSVVFRRSSLREAAELPDALKSYLSIWICDPKESGFYRLAFYLHRLSLIGLSIWLHLLLINGLSGVFREGHPARVLFGVVLIIDLIFLVLSFLLKFSPGWFVSLPLTLFAFVAGYGAWFYHTADTSLFSLYGQPLSDLLNFYYFFVFVYLGLTGFHWIGRNLLTRLLFLVVGLAGAIVPAMNIMASIPLEYALTGIGPFSSFSEFLRPYYLLLHFFSPVTFLLCLIFSFGRTDERRGLIARGMARSFLVLFLVLSFTGVSILQKNRIPHILNALFPNKLNMGSVEIDVLNRRVKLQTANYRENQGSDELPRYRFVLESTNKKGVFLLQSVDDFGFPVRHLTEKELLLTADDQKVSNYKLNEIASEQQIVMNKEVFTTNTQSINLLYRGVYLLRFTLDAKEPPLTISDVSKPLSPTDTIVFRVNEGAAINRLLVQIDEEKFLERTNPENSDIKLPLFYFDVGEHKVSVRLTDELGQEVFKKDVSFSIEMKPKLILLSPLSGDSVGRHLPVATKWIGMADKDVLSVDYLVDEIVVSHVEGAGVYHSLSLDDLSEGAHTLIVRSKTAKGDFETKADFVLSESFNPLQITEPKMGGYVPRSVRVQYTLPEATSVAGVKVFVNGEVYDEAVISPTGIELPISRWQQKEVAVAVQASLADGTQTSDWIMVNKGQGELVLKFDKKSLSFLQKGKLGLLLDASASSFDNWQGAAKWTALKNLMTHVDVEEVLEDKNPSFVVFGSKRPNYFRDCNDARVLVKHGKYDKTEVTKVLSAIKPQGVSALVSALQEELKNQPSRIFVFTDNADSCTSSLSAALKKSLSQSPQTRIDIFALGSMKSADVDQLRALAESTQGRFFQPKNFENLLKEFLGQLALTYQLISGDVTLADVPVENHTFKLVPGDYKIKLPLVGIESNSVDVKISNGTRTTLTIEGNDNENKINVQEEKAQL